MAVARPPKARSAADNALITVIETLAPEVAIPPLASAAAFDPADALVLGCAASFNG